jgi:hypothetical protein
VRFKVFYNSLVCHLKPFWPNLKFTFWLFLGFLFFKGPIESLISNELVRPWLSLIKQDWVTEFSILVFSITLIVIAGWYRFMFNRRPWGRLTSITFFIVVVYLSFYRNQDVWLLHSFKQQLSLFYADVLILGSVIARLLLCIPIKHNKSDTTSSSPRFLEDNPLGHSITNNSCMPDKELDDELGYNSYANRIVKRILSTPLQRSFAIGINGKWGTGKTTFMRLMQRELLKKDTILIEFNPWQSEHPDSIIRDFFSVFEEKIRPYHASLPRRLKRYADKLSATQNNFITDIFNYLTSWVTQDLSVKSLYDEINSDIENIEQKIIVFIDDLDRMESDEIITTIKLIRNTASFNKIYFVVAYDREYVLNAIASKKILNSDKYLEKIFQLEINLPFFEFHRLHDNLLVRLKQVFPESLHEKIDTLFESPTFGQRFKLNQWVFNMRDIIRLINSISINIEGIENDIEFGDFMLLEILRTNHPKIYELIKYSNWKYFKTNKDHLGRDYLYYTESKESDGTGLFNRPTLNQNHESLEKDIESLNLPALNKKLVLNLISNLFDARATNLSTNSISYQTKFTTYFRYELGKFDLSQKDFEKAFQSNSEEFTTAIKRWMSERKEMGLRDKLCTIESYKTRVDFEKTIKAILNFASFQLIEDDDVWSFYRFPKDNLFDKLSNSRVISSHFQNNQNEYKQFINQMFQDQDISPVIASSFLTDFYEKVVKFSRHEFPLNETELFDLIANVFVKYAESLSSPNKAIFRMFYNCRKMIVKREQGGRINTTNGDFSLVAKDAMRNVLQRDFKNYIELMISRNVHGENMFAFTYGIEIFDSIIELGRIMVDRLGESPEDLFLIELKNFYDKLEKQNFEHYVEFTFEHINPKWI